MCFLLCHCGICKVSFIGVPCSRNVQIQHGDSKNCSDIVTAFVRTAAAGPAWFSLWARPERSLRMKTRLKKLSEQVIVITGATSGIGLTTARLAAERGAKLVLAARNEDALKQLQYELNKRGAQARHAVADVGNEEDVRRIAQTAIEHFGRIDTWINNAGVSIFGRHEDVAIGDQRRLFETNFWGVVHGSLVAVEHLKQHGGALINLGSELSDRAVPLQGMYAASKHAVKGFTNSLRMELEAEGAPVSVTLIKPASIDTLFLEHAKNTLAHAPRLPPPVIAPEVVANAIPHAAENPKREIDVGAAAKLVSSTAHDVPRVVHSLIKRFASRLQQSHEPAKSREQHSLDAPQAALRERLSYGGRVVESGLYTKAALHPKITLAVLAAAGLGIAILLRERARTTASPLWQTHTTGGRYIWQT